MRVNLCLDYQKKNYLLQSIIFPLVYYVGLEIHHNSIFSDPVKKQKSGSTRTNAGKY